MIWFSFKGVRSDEYGLLERLPLDARAERITSYVEIPGGMPVAYETTGYKSQIITLNLGIKDVSPENLDAIDAWLFGEGELVFSNDSDRYYLAVCNKALTGSRIIKELGKLQIQFIVLPYKRSKRVWETIELTPVQSQQIVISDGEGNTIGSSEESNVSQGWIELSESIDFAVPVIKVYGSGDISIRRFLPDSAVVARNVTDYVIFDVEKNAVYDKDGNVIENETTSGLAAFRLGAEQAAMIEFENATAVEVIKNMRWL